MGQTKRSSPFFDAWVATVGTHLEECRRAVLDRDFDTLARVAQASALAMHAAMIASTPSLRYWRPGTLAVLDALDRLAADGVPLAYTIDAGPNVKVVLPPGDDHTAFDALRALPAVQRIIQTGPGPGARLVPDAHGAAS
jgi:diphosphomevalonate decarboxylase